jgi:hypothetical protein
MVSQGTQPFDITADRQRSDALKQGARLSETVTERAGSKRGRILTAD